MVDYDILEACLLPAYCFIYERTAVLRYNKGMQRLTIDSSHIVAIGYNVAERTLEIEFKDNHVYQYFEVPANIYERFTHADSYGRYYYVYIDKQYRYRKVEEDDGKPKPLAFVTGNAQKFGYFKDACDKAGIKDVEQLILPVDEIQSDNPEKSPYIKLRTRTGLPDGQWLLTTGFGASWHCMVFPAPMPKK